MIKIRGCRKPFKTVWNSFQIDGIRLVANRLKPFKTVSGDGSRSRKTNQKNTEIVLEGGGYGGVWRLVWVAWLLLVALVCPVGFSCPPVVSNGINIFSGPDRLISCFLWPSPIFGPGFEYWLISMDSLWNSSIFAFPVKVMWFSPRLFFFVRHHIFSGTDCRLLFFFGLRRFLVPVSNIYRFPWIRFEIRWFLRFQ